MYVASWQRKGLDGGGGSTVALPLEAARRWLFREMLHNRERWGRADPVDYLALAQEVASAEGPITAETTWHTFDISVAPDHMIQGPTWPTHRPRPDDDSEPGARCKDCGQEITWIGPSHTDWEHTA